MVELVSLWRRLLFGMAIFAAFFLFGVGGWIKLLSSVPVTMTLVEVSEGVQGTRHPGLKTLRIPFRAEFWLDGVKRSCTRPYLFDQAVDAPASAVSFRSQLQTVEIYHGRAIKGGGATDCWLMTDWKFPIGIAALGFFLGFFVVGSGKQKRYEKLYGKR
jgi:hypothetical protein